MNYTRTQRLVAFACGVVCHVSFVLGIGAMMVGIYTGMQIGFGSAHGWRAGAIDLLLLFQFVALHSILLTQRGRTWLARLVPLQLGADLATTTFATISSWQLLLTFLAWSPLGSTWWAPHGVTLAFLSILYGGAWLLLLRAMADAGLATQTGFLGWGAVVRDRIPRHEEFRVRGTFRFVRQPIYLAFALTLWTGPRWTLDHLILAVAWTAYCVVGPRLKEQRYVEYYGDRFRRYQQLVPYWLPLSRPIEGAEDTTLHA